jgi:hypothetical protein
MKWWITIAILAGLLLLAIPLSAQNQPPAAGQASPSDQTAPTTPPQTEPEPAAPQTPAQASPDTQPKTPPPVTPPIHSSKLAVRKKPGPRASTAGHKVVIRNGGAKDESAQLAPGMSKEQELHSRESTAQLLATTDANLKGVEGRPLPPSQQTALDQIRAYVRQSKQASDAGDLARAHTLAYKAHLLSDELTRR